MMMKNIRKKQRAPFFSQARMLAYQMWNRTRFSFLYIVFFLVQFFGVHTVANAQTYSEVSPSGDLLYYTIANGYATLTGRSHSVTSANPYINLVIPYHITYNGTPMPVRIIGDSAFLNDYELADVVIPQSVKEIGQEAFRYCCSLGTIHVPSSVLSIGNGAFKSVPNVDYHGSAEEADEYWGAMYMNAFEEDGWCYEDSTRRFLIHADRSVTKYMLPSSVEYALYTAFNGTMVDTVYVDSEHPMSDAFSFKRCLNLKVVYFDMNSLVWAVHDVFASCPQLREFNIGSTIDYLPLSVCKDCPSLREVYIPGNIIRIHPESFAGCSGLRRVYIDNGLIVMDDVCFSGCTSLRDVYLGGKLKTIGPGCFGGCDSIREVVLPKSVVSIGGAFKMCPNIEKVTCMAQVPPAVGSGSNRAFQGCPADVEVTVPCGAEDDYSAAWTMFGSFGSAPFSVRAVSEDEKKGIAQTTQQPTCDNPYATVEAFPLVGYAFDRWSDGSTQNPYTVRLNDGGTVELVAMFKSLNAIEESPHVVPIVVYTREGSIVVAGCNGTTVEIYDIQGRRVGRGIVVSDRIEVKVPSTGVYIVRPADGRSRKCVVVK